MSTRAKRKARRNKLRCRNCGNFGAHMDPWLKTYTCTPTTRPPYPGEQRGRR